MLKKQKVQNLDWITPWQKMCAAVGLRIVDPYSFDSLARYLNVAYERPSNFTPEELLGSFGKEPGPHLWPNICFLRWIADECRGEEPVIVSSTWRPAQFNKERDGATDSAHIYCRAIDLHFRSRSSHRIALDKMERLWRSPINWNMGLGVGSRVIHVDFLHKERPRWWKYPTFPEYNGPNAKD